MSGPGTCRARLIYNDGGIVDGDVVTIHRATLCGLKLFVPPDVIPAAPENDDRAFTFDHLNAACVAVYLEAE